jgi:hypothetical protein
MGSKPGKYTQADLNKAAKCAQKAGRVKDYPRPRRGVSVTIPLEPRQPAADLDRELQEFEQRHGAARTRCSIYDRRFRPHRTACVGEDRRLAADRWDRRPRVVQGQNYRSANYAQSCQG